MRNSTGVDHRNQTDAESIPLYAPLPNDGEPYGIPSVTARAVRYFQRHGASRPVLLF